MDIFYIIFLLSRQQQIINFNNKTITIKHSHNNNNRSTINMGKTRKNELKGNNNKLKNNNK